MARAGQELLGLSSLLPRSPEQLRLQIWDTVSGERKQRLSWSEIRTQDCGYQLLIRLWSPGRLHLRARDIPSSLGPPTRLSRRPPRLTLVARLARTQPSVSCSDRLSPVFPDPGNIAALSPRSSGRVWHCRPPDSSPAPAQASAGGAAFSWARFACFPSMAPACGPILRDKLQG